MGGENAEGAQRHEKEDTQKAAQVMMSCRGLGRARATTGERQRRR